jgi:hypothetical protein
VKILIIASTVVCIFISDWTFANEKDDFKVLQKGEIYKFDGQFTGGKTIPAEVECLDSSKEASTLSSDCGKSKHCTTMSLGEKGQTAHLKFKCSP